MAITLQNRQLVNGNRELKFFGSVDLAVDASMYLWFSGYEGSIQVAIKGTDTATFMVYSTVNTAEEMIAETAHYLPAETTHLDDDKDYEVSKGTSGLKITNRATSTELGPLTSALIASSRR